MTRMTMRVTTAAGVVLAGTTLVRWDSPSSGGADAAGPAKARHLAFEENRGQHDTRARYVARGANFSLFLTDTGAVLAVPAAGGATPAEGPRRGVALRLDLVGASGGATAVGEVPLAHRVNYLKGRDASRWVTGVPTYDRVRQRALKPGVDVVWYASPAGTLEYDVDVAPAVDPATIEFDLEGADRLEVTADGALRIHTAAGVVEQDRPVAYQMSGAVREPVESAYELRGAARVGFRVGAYDGTRPLVIDPNLSQLAFSTYLGGSDNDAAYDIAVDQARNVYVASQASSADFPVRAGAFDLEFNGSADVVVTKLNAAATTALYSTYVGGSRNEQQPDLTVDAAGRAHVTGYTNSADFPVTAGAFDPEFYPSGVTPDKAFVTRLAADGASLDYSTFLGGHLAPGPMPVGTWATDIVLDASGNAYVVGLTESADFPVTPGAFDASHNGGRDIFVTKLNNSGTAVIFSTLIGGPGSEQDAKVALLGANIVVAGAASQGFPVTPGAYDPVFNGPSGCCGTDGFVAILNPTGGALLASTYIGGVSADEIEDVAVAPDGFVYVGGTTESWDFPTTPNAFSQALVGASDGFVAKLPPTLHALAYSTLVRARVTALALEPRQCVPGFPCPPGNRVLVGGDAGPSLTTTAGAFDVTYSGAGDGFVMLLNQSGSGLAYSTYFGGTTREHVIRMATDNVGNAYISGFVRLDGNGVPIAGDSVFQKTPGGGWGDGFVAKFGTYVVSGRIVNATGQPLPGVTVTASQGFSAATVTDAQGFYVFDTPSTGSYRVTPSLPGATFSPAFRQFTNPQSNRVANFTRLP